MFGWDSASGSGEKMNNGYSNGTIAGSFVKQSGDDPQTNNPSTPSGNNIDVLTPRPRSAPRIITTPRMNSYADSGSSSSSSSGSGSGFASNQAYPYFAPNKSQVYSPSPLRTAPEHSLPMSMSIPIAEEPDSFPTPTLSSEYPPPSSSYPPSPSLSHPPLPSTSNSTTKPYPPQPPQITIPRPPRPSRTSSLSSNLSARVNSISSFGSSGTPTQVISEPERRQADLQTRVYRARMDLPRHVVLRVFREPEECFEDAGRILDKSYLGKNR